MIYKYILSPVVPTQIDLPANCQILSIQRQDANICVWIDADLESKPGQLTFTPVMTGQEAPEGFYVGTVQTNGGFVIHYYV